MGRLLAILAGLVALLLVPLALSGPTALLLVPGHALLALLASVGAADAGFGGRPESARRWGLFYLVATALMVAALEIGARVRGQQIAYWGVPWAAALVWGWLPPVVSGVAGALGELRERRLVKRVVRRRQRLQNSES